MAALETVGIEGMGDTASCGIRFGNPLATGSMLHIQPPFAYKSAGFGADSESVGACESHGY